MTVTVLSYPNLVFEIVGHICTHLMPCILPIIGIFLLLALVGVIFYVFNH